MAEPLTFVDVSRIARGQLDATKAAFLELASFVADNEPRAISYNVFTALFGGTAPAVNEKLIAVTGTDLAPAFSMMAACVVGAVALVFVPETARASIRGTGVPGVDTEVKPLATPR